MNIGLVGVHAHRTTVNSYRYIFLVSMVTSFQLSFGMLSDGSVDHRYLSPHVFRCSMTIEDDYILPLKFVSWVVRFTYSGTKIIVRVLDGLITRPLPLLFDLYDGPVD